MNATIDAENMDHNGGSARSAPLHAGAFLLAVAILLCADVAFAYRPFDGTDAAVADPGEMEVELQPAGGKSIEGQKTLIAPDLVLNYGFAKDWEAVLEGRLETPLPASGPTTFTDGGVFLKHILRPGVLQDQAGPSIATEFGVLLPDSIGDTRFGASIAGRFPALGLGHGTFEYRGPAHTRSARRPFHGHYIGGAIQMARAPRC